MPAWLLPIIVLGALVFVLGTLVGLGRFRGGRYLRPIVTLLAKIPFMRRLLMKASVKALERENPELASAMRKVERYGPPKTPDQAQKLLSRLTPGERRAYMAAAGEQDAMPTAVNRQQRRAMEKLQQPAPGGGARRKGAGKKKK